jgi:hypothetical protein
LRALGLEPADDSLQFYFELAGKHHTVVDNRRDTVKQLTRVAQFQVLSQNSGWTEETGEDKN